MWNGMSVIVMDKHGKTGTTKAPCPSHEPLERVPASYCVSIEQVVEAKYSENGWIVIGVIYASRVPPTIDDDGNVREAVRFAALMISGAYKSTSAAVLDNELYLAPINLLMQHVLEETAIRIQTGVPWAVPEEIIANTKRKGNAPWRLDIAGSLEMEEARPISTVEGTRTGYTMGNKDSIRAYPHAALADGAIQRIFTDGSGYAGLVGASTVDPMNADWMQGHLGSLDQSNVSGRAHGH
ncbi:hypothetical protein N7448_011301 [Penicillium atrosanguineum]|nr:hypothetical protein N7448_011301 [Penicillium atrosanguineum]